MSKVSIILPVYNSEKFVAKTINSILNQTFTDWELIVIDDFSKDRSLKVIEELKNDKFIILKNDQNRGAAYSRNRGINVASGRFIAFVDSDDIWRKDKLEKQIKFMEDNEIGFSFTSYERVRENGELLTRVNVPMEIKYDELLKNTIILNSTVVFDTKNIDKNLIWMPEYRTSEDTAMFFRILRNGHDAYGINDYLIKYTIRSNSLSSNKFKNMISLWKVYKECENLNFFNRLKNISGYTYNAFKKRVPKDKIRKILGDFKLLKIFNSSKRVSSIVDKRR